MGNQPNGGINNLADLAKCCGSNVNIPPSESSELDLGEKPQTKTEPVKNDHSESQEAENEAPQTAQPPQQDDDGKSHKSFKSSEVEAPAQVEPAAVEEVVEAKEEQPEAQSELVASAAEHEQAGPPAPSNPASTDDNTTQYLASAQCVIAQNQSTGDKVFDIIAKLPVFDWLSVQALPHAEMRAMDRDDKGALYEGEWVGDVKEGRGIQIKDQNRYDGVFANGVYHGFGRLVKPSGDVYTGEFVNGNQCGQGKQDWPDESHYVGTWKQNQINGKGKMTWPDTKSYDGEFVNNLMHGYGLFLWPNGNRYEGNFTDDKKNGKGCFTWPDGRIYDGDWLMGKQHGNGEYTHKNGMARKGVWENGKRKEWTKMENAIADLMKSEMATNTLKNALLKLLQEDALAKNLKVLDDHWVKFNDVLYEESIEDLEATEQKIQAAVNKSQGTLEMVITKGEQLIRATSGWKF